MFCPGTLRTRSMDVEQLGGRTDMPNEWFAQLLIKLELFQGLKPQQLSNIARHADRIQFKPGDKIISEGEAGDTAYLIVDGTVSRVAGPGADESIELGTGTLVGEMAMLVETTYSSTIVCRRPVRALKITRRMLLEQMKGDPELAEQILDRLAARLSRLAEELRKIDRTLAHSLQPIRPPRRRLLALAPPPKNVTAAARSGG